MTVEDESGIANLIVWPKVFEHFRPVVLGARLVGGARAAATGQWRHPSRGGGADRSHRADAEGRRACRRRKFWPGATRSGAPGIDQRGAPPRRPAEAAKIAALVREEPGLAEDVPQTRTVSDSLPQHAIASAMPHAGRNFR